MATNTGVITTAFERHLEMRKMMKAKTAKNIRPVKNELARALELANTLHTTLDLNKLIELFFEETQELLHLNSVSYQNQDLDFSTDVGSKAWHTCSYRLSMAGQKLGELTFSRNQKFAERETMQIEYLISSLMNPLRNAILYQQALNTATKDPLTGVNNRSNFENVIHREVSLALRHENPLSMIVLDIDHFKNVNDTYGHMTGDCVLRDVADCAKGVIRSSDVIFRYGGEEFVILLSNTDENGARLLAERIREAIEKHEYRYSDKSLKVTASLGIATLQSHEQGDQLFSRADKALYQAKQSGRNQCIFSD